MVTAACTFSESGEDDLLPREPTAGSPVEYTPVDIDEQDAGTTDTCDPQTGTLHGLVDTPFCRGRANFDDRILVGLGGNGRACSDCHMLAQNFTLSPAAAETRFATMIETGVHDPLFHPIDANDFRANGQHAGDFSNLRKGLIRITLPLPPNVVLIDPVTNAPSAETVTDVWRAVPSIRNSGVTGPDGLDPAWPPPMPPDLAQRQPGQEGPNGRGGYQHDARFDTLQNQALGALLAHAQIQADPSTSFLDDIAAFETLEVTPAYDPATLTDLERQGEATFNRACAQCHGGVGTTTPIDQVPPNTRYHDISSACPRPVDSPTWCVADGGHEPCPPRFTFKECNAANGLDHIQATVRTYEATLVLPDGTTAKVRRTSSDPGRALLTGYFGAIAPATGPAVLVGPRDDWQKLDVMPLRGIRDTAPYFHNNSVQTLDEVLDHYEAFFKRVEINSCQTPTGCAAVIITGPNPDGTPRHIPDRPFVPAEREALLAFLRRL